ncbi:uncharacterized protein EV422DRAFT_503503 [Fimicolochytrium jonesii]|uniref:uncharacterized protein n=1 Tax=Fimicolochytrium jonesii TaxID=1396493 RepID=UPI0022FE8393|nr:uncharacterized protein EV422DRAFT_503503 [Fimicolochytrium jonesii]KAI8826202.1 hypothetical protein EV422DRAFT_503503 [Fimicolochytrium jonesii]
MGQHHTPNPTPPPSTSHPAPSTPSPSSSNAPPQSPSQPPPPTPGLPFWEQRRAAWTANHTPYTENPAPVTDQWIRDNPALADVDATAYDAIYAALVEGRRFARRTPLPFVTSVLVHGWKKEGLWAPATGIGGSNSNPYPLADSNSNSQNVSSGVISGQRQ